eukprot:TRINITY_DN13037_c0_g1_i1.p1 TRINITY_DN13037_c0_g1~~TRINITY_DN13037_c0_g1_i1.p1  ORF type:complete len:201 (-),score=27.81 TRINITY_DN13037_c0_g1_i1:238-840(-)
MSTQASTQAKLVLKWNGALHEIHIDDSLPVRQVLDNISTQYNIPPESLREFDIVIHCDEQLSISDIDRSLQASLREHIDNHQLSQSSVCSALGVSQGVLSSWLNGQYRGSVAAVSERVRRYLEEHATAAEETPSSAKRPRLKTRHRFVAHQLSVLETEFMTNAKPSHERTQELAAQLQLPEQTVSGWFQNQRQNKRKQMA